MKTGHSQVRKPLQRMKVHRVGPGLARSDERKGKSARVTTCRGKQPSRRRRKRGTPQLQGTLRVEKVTRAEGSVRRKSITAAVAPFSLGVSSATDKRRKRQAPGSTAGRATDGAARHTAGHAAGHTRRHTSGYTKRHGAGQSPGQAMSQAPMRSRGQTRKSDSAATRRRTKRSDRSNETPLQSSRQRKLAEDAGIHGGRLRGERSQRERLRNDRLFLVRLKQARTVPTGAPYQTVKTTAPRQLIMAPPPLPPLGRNPSPAHSQAFGGSSGSREADPAQVRTLTRRVPARVMRSTEKSPSASPSVAVAIDHSDAVETAQSDEGREAWNWADKEAQIRTDEAGLEHLLEMTPDTADSELPAPQEMEIEESDHGVAEHSFPEPCDMTECAVIGEPWGQIMDIFEGDYRIPDENILLVLMDELQSHAEEPWATTELGVSAATD